MAHQITIAGAEETSSPELLLTVGARVRVRVFANRLHMVSGAEAGMETVGVVVRAWLNEEPVTAETVAADGDIIDAEIEFSPGKRKSISCDFINDNRIVQAA